MRRLTRRRSLLIALGVLAALAVAGGSALAASRGGTTVKKGIVTYDAAAISSPTPTLVGTTLGDTWTAACDTLGASKAELRVYIQTTDGSWTVDSGSIDTDPSASPSYAVHLSLPAGSLTTPTLVTKVTTGPGDDEADAHLDLIQLGSAKVSGHIILHLDAITKASPPSETCHLAIEVVPDKVARKVGLASPVATERTRSQPLLAR